MDDPTKLEFALSRRQLLRLGAASAVALATPLRALAADPTEELPFFVLGDWGKANEGQAKVAAAMAEAAKRMPPRFIISVGDNFYPRGVTSTTDERWLSAFQNVYGSPALDCPWYAVLGNHDHLGNPSAEIEYGKLDSRWRMPSRFYSHSEPLADGKTAEFFFLDTTPLAKLNGVQAPSMTDPDQLYWLDRALATSPARWRIVVGHHPVFSGGMHGNTPGLVARLKPLLDRHKVQVYLNGHDHDLQHIVFGGVHYLTSGGGASARRSGNIAGTLFAAAKLGFLSIRLTPAKMSLSILDTGGNALHAAEIPV